MNFQNKKSVLSRIFPILHGIIHKVIKYEGDGGESNFQEHFL